MNKFFKHSLTTMALCASFSGLANTPQTSEVGADSVQIAFDLHGEVTQECYATDIPQFHFGAISELGWHEYTSHLIIKCDAEVDVGVQFDEMPDGNGETVYSDEFIDVYVGVRIEDMNDNSLDFHWWQDEEDPFYCSGTGLGWPNIIINEHRMLPVGGRLIKDNEANRNWCGRRYDNLKQDRTLVTPFLGLVHVKKVPTAQEALTIPVNIALPITFNPFVDQGPQ